MRTRHKANTPGDWYVDTSCTDCSASRTVAPGLIVERDGQSVFARQPETAEELRMAWRARLLCPTASIRTEQKSSGVPDAVFPEAMTQNVWRLGYNAASAAGAHAFLVQSASGNFMIDSPRWTIHVVDAVQERGGLKGVLLTHRDDVGDAGKYARHFGAEVWIHHDDRDRAPFANHLIRGYEPERITEDLLVIPVPGHTRGSVAYLYGDRCLFTGDLLAWSFEENDLIAWRDFCWYSWREQARSLCRLMEYRFEWIFAGHGGSKRLPAGQMKRRLKALIARMQSADITS